MAESIFQPFINFFGTPMGMFILIVAVVIFILYWYVSKKPQEDTFEIENFEDVLFTDVEEKFKLKGIRTKASLTQGFDFLGDVDTWIRERGKHQPLKYDSKIEQFIEDPNQNPHEYDLYIFRIWNANFIFKKLGIGQKKYVVVDVDHVANLDTRTSHKKWNLKPAIQLMRWGNIFVSSEAGEEYLTDIAIKRSHENTLTFLMNYSRKIIYLEMKHSKTMDKYARQKEIDSEQYNKYKKAEGYEEDGEESD